MNKQTKNPKQEKAVILIFEHKEKTQTGMTKNIANSIELELSGFKNYADERSLDTVKKLLITFNCVILTTGDTEKEKVNFVNILSKHCKLKKIHFKKAKIK